MWNQNAAALGGILSPHFLYRFRIDPAVSLVGFRHHGHRRGGLWSFLGIAMVWFGLGVRRECRGLSG